MSSRDLTTWQGTKITAPAMISGRHAPLRNHHWSGFLCRKTRFSGIMCPESVFEMSLIVLKTLPAVVSKMIFQICSWYRIFAFIFSYKFSDAKSLWRHHGITMYASRRILDRFQHCVSFRPIYVNLMMKINIRKGQWLHRWGLGMDE